ncbi:hypothetical protein DPEC_G00218200 [Dallia pectoralis]|uniref:Uncharacterized protein n=1 Tax=Dallia pectoralis TaxID=75939 RepID=A0ACC2G2R3_DALPE|nr:hypothetical protein DPEC_G00218200 [Dallia pectoralis]
MATPGGLRSRWDCPSVSPVRVGRGGESDSVPAAVTQLSPVAPTFVPREVTDTPTPTSPALCLPQPARVTPDSSPAAAEEVSRRNNLAAFHWHDRRLLTKAVEEMETAGFIEPSNSPWSAPVVMVPKKGAAIGRCLSPQKLGLRQHSPPTEATGSSGCCVLGCAMPPPHSKSDGSDVLNRQCLVYLDDILAHGRSFNEFQALRMAEGVLLRGWVAPATGEVTWQLVVPRSLRLAVLAQLHGGLGSGHVRVTKTLRRLRKGFYWGRHRWDVEDFCRRCDSCAASKGPPGQSHAPIQQCPVGAHLEGKQRLWSTHCWKGSSAGSGSQRSFIRTREGTESRVFAEMCQRLGGEKTRTTPLHPQSDGFVERFNKTLAQQLAIVTAQHQKDWDTHLPLVLMACRSAAQQRWRLSISRGKEGQRPAWTTLGSFKTGLTLPTSLPGFS